MMKCEEVLLIEKETVGDKLKKVDVEKIRELLLMLSGWSHKKLN